MRSRVLDQLKWVAKFYRFHYQFHFFSIFCWLHPSFALTIAFCFSRVTLLLTLRLRCISLSARLDYIWYMPGYKREQEVKRLLAFPGSSLQDLGGFLNVLTLWGRCLFLLLSLWRPAAGEAWFWRADGVCHQPCTAVFRKTRRWKRRFCILLQGRVHPQCESMNTEYSLVYDLHLSDVLDTHFESALFLWMILKKPILICAAEFDQLMFSYRIAVAGLG